MDKLIKDFGQHNIAVFREAISKRFWRDYVEAMGRLFCFLNVIPD